VGELEEKVLTLTRNENNVQELARQLEKVKFDTENLVAARVNEMLDRMALVDDNAHEAATKASSVCHRLNTFGEFVQHADARIRTVQDELLQLQKDS